jgi:peroxiredoxin
MKSRPSSAAIAGITALAAFTIFISWRAKALETTLLRRDETPPVVNKPAPQFSLEALDGRTISLADYHGKKKLVVTFWASWCGPCRMEMPALRAFYQKHRNSSDKFELLAVSIDDRRRDAENFAAEEKLPFPVLLDLDSKTADAFGVEGIPTLFVIDENGKIIYGHVGLEPAMEFMLAHQLGFETGTKGGGAGDGESSN